MMHNALRTAEEERLSSFQHLLRVPRASLPFPGAQPCELPHPCSLVQHRSSGLGRGLLVGSRQPSVSQVWASRRDSAAVKYTERGCDQTCVIRIIHTCTEEHV